MDSTEECSRPKFRAKQIKVSARCVLPPSRAGKRPQLTHQAHLLPTAPAARAGHLRRGRPQVAPWQPSQGASFSRTPAPCPTQPQAHSHKEMGPWRSQAQGRLTWVDRAALGMGTRCVFGQLASGRERPDTHCVGLAVPSEDVFGKEQRQTSVLSSASHITGRVPALHPGPQPPAPPQRHNTLFPHASQALWSQPRR